MPRKPRPVWGTDAWIERTRVILDSFERFVGRELIPHASSLAETARQLYEAPFVVVAHGTEDDPILNYANQTALNLWETDLDTLLKMPSRQTAEPMHRDERARMLETTRQQGYIDDYRGVRISAAGKRFRIERAIVWNLIDSTGLAAGQAATFSDWTPL
ncbi:MAG TPA: MEKHLA domain-containing protein [Caulifigura sp.]|nr:MEKHLA domain-containing protein [Caulifigura sp.]